MIVSVCKIWHLMKKEKSKVEGNDNANLRFVLFSRLMHVPLLLQVAIPVMSVPWVELRPQRENVAESPSFPVLYKRTS